MRLRSLAAPMAANVAVARCSGRSELRWATRSRTETIPLPARVTRRLREKWGSVGLLEFEFSDDTGSDYESYDEVARDRAVARASTGAAAE